VLVIDAANVIGSQPTGWWRDRPLAARHLVEQVRAATTADRLRPPVVVVLEGQARRGESEGVAGGVTVVHAPGSGDDTLAEIVARAGEPVVLVTADRGLRRRAEEHGADLRGPRWLLERLAVPAGG
jgi:hypothetical protein